MHVLESYALQNDLKIDRPLIYEKFFPLALDSSSLLTPPIWEHLLLRTTIGSLLLI